MLPAAPLALTPCGPIDLNRPLLPPSRPSLSVRPACPSPRTHRLSAGAVVDQLGRVGSSALGEEEINSLVKMALEARRSSLSYA